MRERAYKRLLYGETVYLSEMGRNGNDIVQVLWELNHEVVTGQYTLPDFDGKPGDLALNRVHPLERPQTKKEQHLTRPVKPQAINTYYPSEETRLRRVREELEKYKTL
jgi:hypothetical protein